VLRIRGVYPGFRIRTFICTGPRFTGLAVYNNSTATKEGGGGDFLVVASNVPKLKIISFLNMERTKF
jgi:hypothetical protein